jgi:transglutaminase/protease-like cytokinesis protein 3
VIDSQTQVGGYPDYPETSRSLAVPDGAAVRQEWLDSLEDEIAVDTSVDLSRLYTLVGSRASDRLLSGPEFSFTWDSVPEGTYTLTAVASDDNGDTTRSSPVSIFVGDVAVSGVSVSPASAAVSIGRTTQLTATVVPPLATNKTVDWSSGDTSVAAVDSSGLVTGLAEGTATITVTTQDGSHTGTSTITVNSIPVSRVSLRPTTISVKPGATAQLTATVYPSDATNKNVSWRSSDTSIATVDPSGLVSGVTAGIAYISVTTEDGSKTATIAVTVTSSTSSETDDNTASDVASTGMIAYPNPVSGQLNVVLENEFAENAFIQLFDNTGRMVLSLKSSGTENSIDMGKLSQGLYLIKVSGGGKCIVQRIVRK